MEDQSATAFDAECRVHAALAVKDVQRSVEFYEILFGQSPTKVRSNYAKFDVAQPPLNLALNESTGPTGPVNPVAHFGIQVKSVTTVGEFRARFESADVATKVEENVACCYAVQDKVWVTDPDGNKWEVFVVLDADSDHYAAHFSDRGTAGETKCCDSPEPC